MKGDASFLGPSRAPTQKADMGSRRARARGPSSPQASPETQMQQNTVNSSVLWRARARARARREKARTAQRTSPFCTILQDSACFCLIWNHMPRDVFENAFRPPKPIRCPPDCTPSCTLFLKDAQVRTMSYCSGVGRLSCVEGEGPLTSGGGEATV